MLRSGFILLQSHCRMRSTRHRETEPRCESPALCFLNLPDPCRATSTNAISEQHRSRGLSDAMPTTASSRCKAIRSTQSCRIYASDRSSYSQCQHTRLDHDV